MRRLAVPVLLLVVLCEGVGALGALAMTTGAKHDPWYQALAKPTWNPPPVVFGPVWVTLYALMGVAAALVWDKQRNDRSEAMTLFAVQLAVNGAWSWTFFRFHQLGLAVLDIVLLVVLVAAWMFHSGRVSRIAAWLIAPYLAWLTFATALSIAIWRLNS